MAALVAEIALRDSRTIGPFCSARIPAVAAATATQMRTTVAPRGVDLDAVGPRTSTKRLFRRPSITVVHINPRTSGPLCSAFIRALATVRATQINLIIMKGCSDIAIWL